MNARQAILVCLALTTGSIATAGCSSMGMMRKNVQRNQADDAGPPREKRKAQIARDFEAQRDSAQFEAAVSRWQENDINGCRKALTTLLERTPTHRQARLLLADTYLFAGKSQEAIVELEKIVAGDPKDAMAHHALAQVLDAQGRREDALTHYRRAIELEPGNQVFALALQTTVAGKAEATEMKSAAASNVQPAAFVDTPERVNLTRDAAPPAKLETNTETMANNPQIRHDPLQQAVDGINRGDYGAAIDAACKGLADTPEQAASLYRVLGAAHYRRGEYEAAQSALAQALSLDKANGLSYFLMGSTLTKLGQSDAAAWHFAEAARLDARFAR